MIIICALEESNDTKRYLACLVSLVSEIPKDFKRQYRDQNVKMSRDRSKIDRRAICRLVTIIKMATERNGLPIDREGGGGTKIDRDGSRVNRRGAIASSLIRALSILTFLRETIIFVARGNLSTSDLDHDC